MGGCRFAGVAALLGQADACTAAVRGSAQYDELLSAGAFAEFTSRKIFEEATLA